MEELGSREAIQWYERDFTLEDAMGMIQGSMKSAVRNYVAVGFYLKAIRDRKLFEEAGYRNFEEFVRDKYDKDKGWASKCIKVNDRLSKYGNTPLLAEEYKEYNVSQLVELAAMTDEQRAQVTPKTSVREMKQIRNPKPEEPKKVVTLQLPEKTIEHFTDGDQSIDNAYGATISKIVKAYLAKGLVQECMVAAWGDTYRVLRRPDITVFYTEAGETIFDVENSRLEKEYQYWYRSEGVANQDGDAAISQQTEPQTEPEKQTEPDSNDEIVVDTSTCPPNNNSSCRRQEWGTSPKEQEAGHKECVRCWEDWKKAEQVRRAENRTEQEADKEDTEPEVIDVEFSEVEEPEDESLTDLQIARRELERATAALELYVRALDDIKNPPPKPEQPELPILRNNDQRAAFVDAYETWPLWIETAETGERYYRYDLQDGTSMVVKVYHTRLFDYSKTDLPWEERYTEGYGRHEYYLLKPGKFFRNCEANRSALIDKLKEIQKKG